MTNLPSPRPAPSSRMRMVAAASFAGALMEWYDFFLYGTASALVFSKLFFPSLSPVAGTAASFATFGVGFVARPLGGVIFGHFGDRVGRKSMLIATVMIIGCGTFLIGLLPTYSAIGVWAPILLVILRLLQGIGLGGEYAGAALMTIEHAPGGRRGFWGSIPQAASSAGILLGTGIFDGVSGLPRGEFLTWGWRIPFLISVVLLVVGLVIRLRVSETPLFMQAQRERERRGARRGPVPLAELLRRHPRNLTLAFGARLAETVSSNIFNAFAISYIGTTLAMSKGSALNGILIGSAIGIPACPVFGALADRIGRRTVYLLGAGFTVVFAFPFFLLLNSRAPGLVWLAVVVGYVFGPTLMFAAEATFFAELFGTETRYTGLSLAYQVSAIVGGFTPLIATALLTAGGRQPWLVGTFLAGIGLLSAVSAYAAKGGTVSPVAVSQAPAVGLPAER
jgi:MFS transporter, MHS family, shikimate and dehydroshikimate transport protein